MAGNSTGRRRGRPSNIELYYDEETGFKIPTAPSDFNKEEKKYWRQLWEASSQYADPKKDWFMIKQLARAMWELDWKTKALADRRYPKNSDGSPGAAFEDPIIMANNAYARHPYAKDCDVLKAQIVSWTDLMLLNPTARYKNPVVPEEKKVDANARILNDRQNRKLALQANIVDADVIEAEFEEEEGLV